MDILKKLRVSDFAYAEIPFSAACSQRAEAADEIERLREALRPFAALAEHYPMTKMYGNRPTSGVLFEVSSANKTAGYTVEDLHAAAAALGPNLKLEMVMK